MKQDVLKQRVLVIDDEEYIRDILVDILNDSGYLPELASNGQEGAEKFEKAFQNGKHYRFVFCDIKMPIMDGLQFLERIKDKISYTAVIMMSGYGDINTAVTAMKLGAYDYISKPFEVSELKILLEKAAEFKQLKNENLFLRQQIEKADNKSALPDINTRNPEMKSAFERAAKAAEFHTTVLITGESGTGKELIAKSIHAMSDVAAKPLVAVNCGSIPENLIESELFGYKKGAFTGANKDRKGLFEEADGGTIFLDEIGELPAPMQVKLLRVLQENEIRPVGEVKTKKIKARVIAATSRDLIKEIQNGNFRQDLFFRLNVLTIYLPPLRERKEDIPLLSEHFLKMHNLKLEKKIKSISPDAMKLLLEYSWPGNVRELENMIERAIVLTQDEVLQAKDFPSNIKENSPQIKASGQNIDNLPEINGFSMKEAKTALEIKMINKALEKTNGNRSQAARLLEISHPSLLSKIKDYGITR